MTSVSISPHCAALAVWVFGDQSNGRRPSSGEQKLFDLITGVDPDFRKRVLRDDVPEVVACTLARREGGMDVLRAIVESGKPMPVITNV